MAIRHYPKTDGQAAIPFGDGAHTRASSAYHPDTGKCHRDNVPRITSSRLAVFTRKPKIYYSFPADESPFGWDATHPNANTPYAFTRWISGSDGRAAQFEREFPEFERLVLGQSGGRLSGAKDILGYRLKQEGAGDALATKHCVFTSCCHGNETRGINGIFKACEILARHADFADFRKEWTLLFVPWLNPDGWYNHLRNTENLGSNGKTVNLNRNWDWFWDEYVEDSAESKGSTPGDTPEAQAILDYYADVVEAGGSFGTLVDAHATGNDVPARYVTRDRTWLNLGYGPGDIPYEGTVPEHYITKNFDFSLWCAVGALGNLRVREETGPDWSVRYYKSRYRPVMHAYFSSQGALGIGFESAKLQNVVNDAETCQTACNFRMDFLLTHCLLLQLRNWAFKDALLVEPEATNILENSLFADWQDASRVSPPTTPEERPSYYSVSRVVPHRETMEVGTQWAEGASEVLRLVSDTDMELAAAAEYASACTDTLNSIAIVVPSNNVFIIPSERASRGNLFLSGLTLHTRCYGVACFRSGTKQIDILGGGSAPGTSPWNTATRVTTNTLDGATPAESAITLSGAPTIMECGFCDNSSSQPATRYGWLFGGYNGTGDITTIRRYKSSDTTISTCAGTLAHACRGALAVYVSELAKVFVFGGKTGSTFYTDIQKFDCTAGTILTQSAVLPVGLAFAVGGYSWYNNKIYIFGGEKADGTMSSVIYEYDPYADSIVAKDVRLNMSDTEDGDSEGGSYWATAIGRAAGALLYSAYGSSGETILLIGGRYTDTAGDLSADMYTYDPIDNTIGLMRIADFGYVRNSTMIDDSFTGRVLLSDVFDSSGHANWYDPNGTWAEASGVATCSGLGWFCPIVAPVYRSQQITFTAQKSGVGDIGDLSIHVRNTEDVSHNLNSDGYCIYYSEEWDSWFLFKAGNFVCGSGAGDIALTTGERTGVFTVIGDNPVRLQFVFNGVTCFDVWDLEESRVTRVGRVGVMANPDDVNVVLGSFVLAESAVRDEVYSASMMVKSAGSNLVGYTRGDIEPSQVWPSEYAVTRRTRNYYTLPSKHYWQWYRNRLDMRIGPSKYYEAGLRNYLRIYKNDQQLLVAAPMLVRGSLLGASFHPDGETRAAEHFDFSAVFNVNDFQFSIYFSPIFSPIDLDADLTLLECYPGTYDADNRIAVVAKAATGKARFEREYNRDDVYGPHDPVIQIQKWVGGTMTASADVVAYFGYTMRDTSTEPVEDLISVRVIHRVGDILELQVDRYGSTGRGCSRADLSAFASAQGSLRLAGAGWWSEPTLEDAGRARGRLLSSRRPALARRARAKERGAFLMGDRDPSGGGVCDPFYAEIAGHVMRTSDAMTAGANWNIQAGSVSFGVGGAAVGAGVSMLWSFLPRQANVRITMEVNLDTTNDYIGILAHVEAPSGTGVDSMTSGLRGVGVQLVDSGGGLADLSIVRYWNGSKSTLAYTTVTGFTPGNWYTLQLEVDGTTITGSIVGTAFSVDAEDTIFLKPAYLAVFGNAATHAHARNFDLYPNFESRTE